MRSTNQYLVAIISEVIMVLAASFEFEKSHNSEIVERPSDNEEVPQVCIIMLETYSNFFVLNSAETKIYSADKSLNLTNYSYFNDLNVYQQMSYLLAVCFALMPR